MRHDEQIITDILRAKAIDIQAAHNDLQLVQNEVVYTTTNSVGCGKDCCRKQQIRAREEYEHYLKMLSFAKIEEAELRADSTQSDANLYPP